MTEENKPTYSDAVFIGREFKKKGEGKKGEWQLFIAKFSTDDSETGIKKYSAFANPRKGMCIKDCIEGNTYNIGYRVEEKTFTNQSGEEITYDARTIFFIDEKKDAGTASKPAQPKEELGATPKAVSDDLLSGEVSEEEIVLNTPVTEVKLSSEEEELLNKIKKLPAEKVTEKAFKDTCDRLPNCGANRKDELYRYFQEKMK